MTQEDKQLLLVDLSARLPYGVKLKHTPTNEITTLEFIGKSTIDGDIHDLIENFSVYLFPLSSMTLKQRQELDTIVRKKIYREINYHECIRQMIHFYHKYHLDYRGLIPMGLAIDATNLNIYQYE